MSTLPEQPEYQRPQMFYGRPLTYEHKRHMYFWGGQHVPSVTTIIKRLDKPGLLQWAADMAVGHIREQWAAEEAGRINVNWLECFEQARKAHAAKRDAAADIGTVLHDIAEHVQSGRQPGPELVGKLPVEDQLIASNCAIALQEWMAAQRFGTADLERRVFSKELMYAGRCDRFGLINGHMAVLDFKSGGDKIYPETWLP
jgi:hypothetical protein